MKSSPIRNFLFSSLILLLFLGCTKDMITNSYSTEHLVNAYFDPVSSYLPLQQVLGSPGFGNPGQYCTIRKHSDHITIASATGSINYSDAIIMKGSLGLGGLIVGTNYDSEYYVFDLACPNCNQAQYRLTVPFDGTGIVTCNHCKISYDLNYGTIRSTEGNTIHSNPRSLFRYHIGYTGMSVGFHN